MRRARGPRLVAAAVVAGVVAAGCGGDDDAREAGPPATATATATATSAQPRDCGQVAFTPQSDHGAFQIESRGTSCDTARAIATAAEGQSSAFSAEGFECSGEIDRRSELRSVRWTCASGDAQVTFVTS